MIEEIHHSILRDSERNIADIQTACLEEIEWLEYKWKFTMISTSENSNDDKKLNKRIDKNTCRVI